MTLQIVLFLCVAVAALVLFSLERLPPDVIGLGVLLVLVLAGLLPAEQAFAGFGSDTVVMIFCLLVLTAALVHTGVVDAIGRAILRRSGDTPLRVRTAIAVVSAALSVFISNTAATALFVPITIDLSRRARISVSKLLMPLAFATILASSVTLVGTSTNLVVSGLMTQYGLPPLGMFELTVVGLPILLVGLAYVLLVGYRLIPDRLPPGEEDAEFGIRPYLAELVVLNGSPLIGKTLDQAGLGRDLDLTVLRVLRAHPVPGADHYLAPRPELRLNAEDELLVKGQHDEILKAKDVVGIAIKGDVALSDPRLLAQDMRLVEVMLLPGSPLVGHTLKGLDFRQRYGLHVLGMNRRGRNTYRKLSSTALRTGDQLLVQGYRSTIASLDQDNTFRILGTVAYRRPDVRRAPVAIAIFGGALLLAALEVLYLPVAVLLGAVLAFVMRCITPEEAYREVQWRAIIVIGSMLTLGTAMEYTGTASYLAAQIAGIAGQAGALWLLSAFFVLTLLLTQPMSNQAAAVVVIPVAIQTALQLGLNPRTFAVMIAVAASCSFLTPLEPACLMVYGPGRYRFLDFVKVGAPLTVLVYLIAIALVPLIWPL